MHIRNEKAPKNIPLAETITDLDYDYIIDEEYKQYYDFNISDKLHFEFAQIEEREKRWRNRIIVK